MSPLHVPLMWPLYVGMSAFESARTIGPRHYANPELRCTVHAFPDLFAIAVQLFVQLFTCGNLVVVFSNLEVSRGLPIEYLLLYVETLTPLARAMREHYHTSDVVVNSNTLQRLLGILSLTVTGQNGSLRKYTLSAVARLLLLNPQDPSFRQDFASFPIPTTATIRACRYPKPKRLAIPIPLIPHHQLQPPIEIPLLTLIYEIDIGAPFPGDFPSMLELHPVSWELNSPKVPALSFFSRPSTQWICTLSRRHPGPPH